MAESAHVRVRTHARRRSAPAKVARRLGSRRAPKRMGPDLQGSAVVRPGLFFQLLPELVGWEQGQLGSCGHGEQRSATMVSSSLLAAASGSGTLGEGLITTRMHATKIPCMAARWGSGVLFCVPNRTEYILLFSAMPAHTPRQRPAGSAAPRRPPSTLSPEGRRPPAWCSPPAACGPPSTRTGARPRGRSACTRRPGPWGPAPPAHGSRCLPSCLSGGKLMPTPGLPAQRCWQKQTECLPGRLAFPLQRPPQIAF
jgi:hypothetical protein